MRDPYNPKQVTKYSLSPEIVDLIAFCTKNPLPMLPFLDELKPYGHLSVLTVPVYPLVLLRLPEGCLYRCVATVFVKERNP